MGLDAAVYLNGANIVTKYREFLLTDAATGEVYLTPEFETRTDFESEALAIRLGNISGIGCLWLEICEDCVSLPIVCGRILESGSHSGDVIEIAEIPQLELEIVEIESKDSLSIEVQNFVASVRELMRTAIEQQNPIVFL